MKITLQQNVRLLDNDLETVIGLFLSRFGCGDGILLESAEVDGRWGRYSLAAGDFLFLAACRDGLLDLTIRDERLEPLRVFQGRPYLEGLRSVMKAIDLAPDPGQPDLPPITRALYGYLGYGAAGLMEEKLRPALPPREAEGSFGLPGHVYLFDHTYNQLAHLSLGPPARPAPAAPVKAAPPVIGPVSATFSRAAYLTAALKIKDLIARGEVIEVALAPRFSAPFQGDLFDVYRRLRRLDPSPYMFFLRLPGLSLAVSSPEVLVSCEEGRLRLCPVTRTRPRAEGLSADSLFEEEPYPGPEEKAEQALLVDLGRNDLGRVAAPGSVKVDRFMEAERFAQTVRLTSRLSADLAPGRDAVDIIEATFPSGSLSGTPKVRALGLIAELEPEPRGPFGGALGWLGLDQGAVSLDLGLTIRGLWSREDRVFWQTAAALVHNSDPESQWRQCVQKGREILAALAPEMTENFAAELMRTGGQS